MPIVSSVNVIGIDLRRTPGKRHVWIALLYARQQGQTVYRSVVAAMKPLIDAFACSKLTMA